jgi:mannosylglycerate hydrolase
MRNLHVISHTHWDREWYLPFQLFRLKLVRLVDGLLEILEKDPDFKHFMLDGQTIVLDDYLQMRPEKEIVLRDHIRKGRVIIGPWHILPDMFLVGPEAHIRNLLQGERTSRKYGPKMMIGYMPDSFGHIGQIPQILCGFGIEAASLWRGVHDGPAEFWWQAPDGSRVLMAYLREGYGNGADLPAENLERFASMLAKKGDTLASASASSELLIMYGTDHMEPPINTSEAIAYADEMLRDTHVLHSTLPHYISAIQASIKKNKSDLPTLTGELRDCKRMPLLPGVLSTRMWIKQRNHTCETLLEKWVEPFTTFASNYSSDPKNQRMLIHPSSIIRHTWCLLMENHPHDSICGCSIDQVHDEMKVRFDQVEQIGEEITKQALESLASCISTIPASLKVKRLPPSAIIVFNPSPVARTDAITTTIQLPPKVTGFEIFDEVGRSIPYQEHGLGSHEIINITLDRNGLLSAFGNISDGRAAGMVIQDVLVRRAGADVFIEAIMSNEGEPNLSTWNSRRKEIEAYFADASITTYHVLAHSITATQIITTVPDVPGLGYRTLWVYPHTAEDKAPFRLNPLIKALLPLGRLPVIQNLSAHKRYAKPPFRIENEFFVVEVKNDGSLTLIEKKTSQIYLGLNRFQDGGDCGDEYNYSPPFKDKIDTPRLKHVSITRGSAQQTLDIELELKIPLALSFNRRSRSKETIIIPILTTILLSNGVPRIDIHTTVKNQARDHRLRVHFPAPFSTQVSTHDGHFEVVERKVGIQPYDDTWVEQPRPEVPQRAFSSITDGTSGLMIANRGLTEVEVLTKAAGNAEVAITLLRCVGWLSRDDLSTRKGHAGPFLKTPGAQMQGIWTFDYSIIPYADSWKGAYTQAYSFETPLRSTFTTTHAGTFPSSGSFLNIEPATFVISAIKQSEDGDGWIVRGYNITGESIQVTLKPWGRFRKVDLVNLAENKRNPIKPDQDGSIHFQVRGHGIASILFRK